MKNKKILAMLIATATMVTSGPAMALDNEVTQFDPEDTYEGIVTWSENFDTATVDKDTEKTYDRVFESGEFVRAVAGNDQTADPSEPLWNATVYYYDLSNAELEGGEDWTREFYERNVDDDGNLNDTAAKTLRLMVHKPDNAVYEEGKTEKDDAEFKGEMIWFDDTHMFPYKVTYKATGFDKTKTGGSQTVTISATVNIKDEFDDEMHKYCEDRLLGNTTFEKQIVIG